MDKENYKWSNRSMGYKDEFSLYKYSLIKLLNSGHVKIKKGMNNKFKYLFQFLIDTLTNYSIPQTPTSLNRNLLALLIRGRLDNKIREALSNTKGILFSYNFSVLGHERPMQSREIGDEILLTLDKINFNQKSLIGENKIVKPIRRRRDFEIKELEKIENYFLDKILEECDKTLLIMEKIKDYETETKKWFKKYI